MGLLRDTMPRFADNLDGVDQYFTEDEAPAEIGMTPEEFEAACAKRGRPQRYYRKAQLRAWAERRKPGG